MTDANIKNGTNGHSTNGKTPNTNGNGHHGNLPIPSEQNPALDAAPAILWDILPPAVIEKLGQTLDPGLVSQRKGRAGRTYSYVEGRTAIDQANRIFGHGGWGYDLVGEVSLRDTENVDGQTGEVKRVRAYSATVRVNVTGALSRTDVGFHAVAEGTTEGHDTAYKAAVTDALKRALRSFGDQFGNSLYGDGSATTDTIAPSLRQTLLDLGVTQGFDEEKVRAAVKSKTGKELDDLPASELTSLVEGAVKKIQQAGTNGEAKQAE